MSENSPAGVSLVCAEQRLSYAEFDSQVGKQSYTYTFTLEGGTLTARVGADGSVTLTDENGGMARVVQATVRQMRSRGPLRNASGRWSVRRSWTVRKL